MQRTLGLVVLAAGILLLVPFGYPAGADDWPQYRRDAWRTGASRDRLGAPLVEVWNGPAITALVTAQRAECAVWRGRAYFFAADPIVKRSYLVCADVRTGTTV